MSAALRELEDENARLRELLKDKVVAETMLHELHITPGNLSAVVEGGMAGVLAQCLVDQYNESGATNFLEMKFHDKAGNQYVVTTQRIGGLTPADKTKAAEAALLAKSAEYDALVARVEAAPVAIVDVDEKGWGLAVTMDNGPLSEQAEALDALHDKRVRLLASDDRPSHTAGDE